MVIVGAPCSLKDVCDRPGVPLAPACRRDASCVWRLRNLPQCARASLLRLTDDRKHVGRVPICFVLHGVHGALAGHVELRVAKGHPASLAAKRA